MPPLRVREGEAPAEPLNASPVAMPPLGHHFPAQTLHSTLKSHDSGLMTPELSKIELVIQG